jgi:hypothetical protein
LLTLIGMHFDVKLGKEQLTEIEQPNVDIPTKSIATDNVKRRSNNI